MNVRCAVTGCGNDAQSTKESKGKVFYFEFPTNEDYALEWYHAIEDALEVTTRPIFVCSRHFDQSELIQDPDSGEVKLSPGAVPKIKANTDNIGRYVLVKMKDGDTRLVPGGAVVKSGKTITLKATARKSTAGGIDAESYLSKLKPILPKPDMLPLNEQLFIPIRNPIVITEKSLEIPKEQIIQENVHEKLINSSASKSISPAPKEDILDPSSALCKPESVSSLETSKNETTPNETKMETHDAEDTETADSTPPASPSPALKRNLSPVVLLQKLNLPPDKVTVNLKEYEQLHKDHEKKRKSRKSPVRTSLCCVLGCSSSSGSSGNIKLYDLPKEVSRRKKWLTCLGLIDSDLPNLKICSKHFIDSDFTSADKSKFKANAVPSTNLAPQVKKSTCKRKVLLESSDDETSQQPKKNRKIEIIAEVEDTPSGISKKSYRVSVKKFVKKEARGGEPKRGSVLMDCKGSVKIVKQIVQSLDITKMKEINYKPGGSDESEVVLHGEAGDENNSFNIADLEIENEKLKDKIKIQSNTIANLVQSKRRLQKKLTDAYEQLKKLRSGASTSQIDIKEMEVDNDDGCIVLGDSD